MELNDCLRNWFTRSLLVKVPWPDNHLEMKAQRRTASISSRSQLKNVCCALLTIQYIYSRNIVDNQGYYGHAHCDPSFLTINSRSQALHQEKKTILEGVRREYFVLPFFLLLSFSYLSFICLDFSNPTTQHIVVAVMCYGIFSVIRH